MVKVTDTEESQRRLAEGSINAFLNGRTSQNWAIAMIRTSGINKEALKKLFSEFYTRKPKNVQLRELEKACKQMGLL
jgi:hypothetical protein